jgi:hypothetical protein
MSSNKALGPKFKKYNKIMKIQVCLLKAATKVTPCPKTWAQSLQFNLPVLDEKSQKCLKANNNFVVS